MRKHLIYYSDNLLDHSHPFNEIGTREYLIKRLQFWKWYKHHTMGRPILMLRKPSHEDH